MAMLDDTLRELGSRVTQARLQGQEAAELKKSGEISVLQKELGSKSKYVARYWCCNMHSPTNATLLLVEVFPQLLWGLLKTGYWHMSFHMRTLFLGL